MLMSVKVVLAKDILEENKKQADDLRNRFSAAGVRVVNILSSPGAGKTSLLETTIPMLSGPKAGVIEGDVATTRDADRLAHIGVPVVQITTMGACHLDQSMIWSALSEIDLNSLDLLFIENVGNLVCPSNYDLGEELRIVVLSTTEGSDKPAKYPAAFLSANVVVINKTDLLPYTDFDITKAVSEIKSIRPDVKIFQVSCRTKDGMAEWAGWLGDWVNKRQKS
jgi:hydrogenase nickel incorporation protein HypB